MALSERQRGAKVLGRERAPRGSDHVGKRAYKPKHSSNGDGEVHQ